MKVTRYSQKDVENVLARMDMSEIDKLPCGAIQLDHRGHILFYSAAESKITGRAATTMVGKNFFKEVAPCTDTPAFYGEFLKVVQTGTHQASFLYTFDYQMEPIQVSVFMARAASGDSYWVLVNRL
ncbi:MAG: photoactive yellow protein [Bryobacteraceae bacterium]|nr:photoactive yellow protein [Bryobacteraceae bacterium]